MTTVLDKERLQRKFKELFDHAVESDALNIWHSYWVQAVLAREDQRAKAAEAKAVQARERERLSEEDRLLKIEKLKEAMLRQRNHACMRSVFGSYWRWMQTVKNQRAEEKLRLEATRSTAIEQSRLEALANQKAARVSARFFQQLCFDDMAFCFNVWTSESAAGRWVTRERFIKKRIDGEMVILKTHMAFLRDQAVAMFLQGRSRLVLLDVKTILTEWYIFYLLSNLRREHKETTSELRSKANRGIVEADHRSFEIGQATAQLVVKYKAEKMMATTIFHWNRFAVCLAADRREMERVKTVQNTIVHAEREKTGAISSAVLLASKGIHRRNENRLVSKCVNTWFSNTLAWRLQRMHAEQWQHHGTLMEKLWDRVEVATMTMSRYCSRQGQLVAVQRCLSSWMYSTRLTAVQDNAFKRQMEAERSFEDDAGQMMAIYSKRVDLHGLKLMMHKEAWQQVFNVKLYFLKWSAAVQIIAANELEERERFDHEDQLAELIKAHGEDRRLIKEEIKQRYIAGVEMRYMQKFFTGWQNVKSLRRKTAMLEFLGVGDDKRSLPFDKYVHDAMIESLTNRFAEVNIRRARREVWYRLFVTWRDVAEYERFQREMEAKSKMQHEAYIRLRDEMKLKVDLTRERYQEEFEHIGQESLLNSVFNRWLVEITFIRIRKLSRGELRTREAQFDDELLAIEDVHKDKMSGTRFQFWHLLYDTRCYMLLFISWRGWRFLRTLQYVDMLREEIETLREKHKTDVVKIRAQNVKYLTAYANNGWRMHHYVMRRWKYFFAWRRSIMITPQRHEEMLENMRYAMCHRRNLTIQFLIENPSRHTAGMFSLMYYQLLLLVVVGRWGLVCTENRSVRVVDKLKSQSEAALERQKAQMFSYTFSNVEKISQKYAYRFQLTEKRYVFCAWHSVATCSAELRLNLVANKQRVMEVEASGQDAKYRRSKLAEGLIARYAARQKVKIHRHFFIIWRSDLSQDKLAGLQAKVRGLTTDLNYAKASFDRQMEFALQEQATAVVETIVKLTGNFAHKRGDLFLVSYIFSSWCASSSMGRERMKIEEERIRRLTDHRLEVGHWKELDSEHRWKAEALEASIEKMALLTYDTQMIVGLFKYMGIWRVATFMSVEARKRSEHQRKIEERFREEFSQKALASGSKEETAKRRAAASLVSGKLRQRVRLCFTFWHRLLQHHRFKSQHVSTVDEHRKAFTNALDEHDKEARKLKGQLADKTTEVAAWIKVARWSAALERCLVAWRMQVRIMRLEEYDEISKKDFEARLEQESGARSHAEAEARHQRPSISPLLQQNVGTQTGEDRASVERGGKGRSAAKPPASKPASDPKTAPAERMLGALRRVCRRNLVASLLALLTYEPKDDQWRRRRGQEATSTAPNSWSALALPPVPQQVPTPAGVGGATVKVIPARPVSPVASGGAPELPAWNRGDGALPDGVAEAADSLGRRALEKLAQVRRALAVPDDPLVVPPAADGAQGSASTAAAFEAASGRWQDLYGPSAGASTREFAFAALDVNQDGIISREELRRIDLNHDGGISREEFRKAVEGPAAQAAYVRPQFNIEEPATRSAAKTLERPLRRDYDPDPNRSSILPSLELEAQLESLQRSLDAMDKPAT